MAIDRRLKKKKKRDEKQKARRQEAQRQLLQEKAEEYGWQSRQAFRLQDYRRALTLAQKMLKLEPSDTAMRDLAIRCAQILGDRDACYTLLCQSYERGEFSTKNNCIILGQLAFERKNYALAKELFQLVVSKPSPMKGKLTKTDLQQLEQYVKLCSLMNRPTAAVPPKIPPPPAQQTATKAQPVPAEAALIRPEVQKQQPGGEDGAFPPATLPALKIAYRVDADPLLEAVRAHRKADPATLDLALKAYKLSFRTSYDQLICLPTLRDVQSFWHQEETARKVMKTFRGRAILADEVGLGKTVEAGLILKEYLLRGLVRRALILTPSSLVNQWQEELQNKFAIPLVSTNDPLFRQRPEQFWEEPLVLASLQTAKLKRHFDAVVSHFYDMVIVDEAHHLKNRSTLNWKLVNTIQKSFLLMLTATPVQNNLEELFNLVTLLQPGHLKTRSAFKEEFVTRGNPTDPRNREKLRQLLKEVMVRNTRSVTRLHLPPRFALTVRVSPTETEEVFYQEISAFAREQAARNGSALSRFTLRRLLETAGSSHLAALRILERMLAEGAEENKKQIAAIIRLGREIKDGAKIRRVMELLRASSNQKILFVNSVATLEYLHSVLVDQGLPHVVFQGGLTPAQKQAVMDRFRNGCQILLSTGMGGEGFNLQFCHTMINYDLPWNPMEIEQRIGRIHRIGQENEVQVFNFCAAGSIEDQILEVLDRKINMFELVVGEIDMILGRLQGEEEFSDLVYEIWVRHTDEAERQKAFDGLAARLKRARANYEKSKELDEKLFQEDFGV